MIDKLAVTSPNPEIIRNPESSMGLQTYEYLAGGGERTDRIEEFLAGKVAGLNLDYPRLELAEIDEHISNLSSLVPKEYAGSASAEFRLAEAYFLKACQQIKVLGNPSQPIVDQFQEINESIYGRPDEAVVDQMLAGLWAQLEAKKGGIADDLIAKLESGWTFTAQDGSEVAIPALPKPSESSPEPLPTLTEEAKQWIFDLLTTEYAPVREVFEEYYHQQVESRDDPSLTPADIVAMFNKGVEVMNLQNVAILEDENATALSWSSIDSAVVVGMKRNPLSSIDEALGVFVHEVGVHGRRYASGKDLGDSSLTNGLFTEADEGEVPDYLTFEEGLAGTLQKIMQGDEEKWGLASTALYLNVAFAHMGWTPRQVQEVMTQVRVVLGLSPEDQQIPDSLVAKSSKTTATGAVRIFRGTPTSRELKTTEGVTLHYAKDLAYASGKIKAIPLLNKIASLPEPDRSDLWNSLFLGKYDPTNRRHKDYALRVAGKV